MKHQHYRKPISHLEYIDVYRVLDLFDVSQPAIQHAVKKLLCGGKRGAKNQCQDWQEAIDSINRALQMEKEDADGWNDWDGGDCPVAPNTVVEVELSNGQKITRRAMCIGWNRMGLADVIAYRVVGC